MRCALSAWSSHTAALKTRHLRLNTVNWQMNSRYVIIGFGIAGLSAARAIRSRDKAGEILILTAEQAPFYSRPGLAYNLTGTIPESQLFALTAEELSELNLKVVHAHARSIAPPTNSIRLSSGDSVEYDRLLLATGASALKPATPGMDLQGVVTLDTLTDTRQILKLARRAHRAVVIGGGITAVELAEGLAARGLETHYFLRGGRYWKRVLDQGESQIVEDGMRHEGIKIQYNTSVARVLGSRGRVKGVLTEQGQKTTCQIVGVAIGIRPNKSLAEQSGLAVDRGILVDEYMRTSQQHIFAAGDVAQVFDPPSGEHKLDSLWWQAGEQGRVAGSNMAGASDRYLRGTPFNVTRVGGVTITIVGAVGQGGQDADLVSIVHGDSENWRDQPDSITVETQDAGHRIRLVVGPDSLFGAVIMGDQSMASIILDLIRQRTSLGRFRGILLDRPQESIRILEDLARTAARDRLVPAGEY
jgi:NAD(P)H-nitrite reductase large subunit